ncbi:carbon-nitrogen hydrolase family protein [Carbonactinospora thermoautotrophica]|uniref:carbon-nitrogen hydrolase family protein n=1 Tax=Carbonactinospora thermoautotrophica TaxID=1469144 RepID=UPI00226DA999|nr:carbon-nitrogen hydrolase family protein [Carbonactinospora thermoautotrophica]MCX9192970.1 carbon-nitrogen hydrolase family protein [Carbonactinospora thermoautotrophica]
MRSFTAAAIQLAPVPGPLSADTIKANLANAVEWVERCVDATGAELVVLPESASTGFTPGVPAAELWDLVSEIPGPVTEPLQETARRLGVHLVWGTYERGPERGVVYNSAALIGPGGDVLGVYRKTHPFGPETVACGGWVTPGDASCVVQTPLGRIGIIICFDGDFPELSRVEAVQGAELICRPSAFLRSADIWELTSRARAYDNHVYVIGANATGTDPAGVHYFGNSLIVTPIAEVVAKAASHECWIAARLEPDDALMHLTPGSSVPQPFDHLEHRNLAFIRRYADELTRPAKAAFRRSVQ